MKVVLGKPAAISIILSAVEVYKKETYGILLGERNGQTIKVNQALSFQSANRDYEYVSMETARENRINYILRYLSGFKVVGDFHSHPDFPEKLSKHDTEELRKAGEGTVSVLILIKKTSAGKKWRYDAAGKRIAGVLAGRYFIGITASIYNYKKKKAERIPLICRHLKEMNQRIRLYSKLEKKLEKLEKEEMRAKRLKKMLVALKMKV
ncbi:MAG: Mov34/MPN/PAD-1 family protein [Candidatus Aenigmarchaeota archaeon]|nr:Mov34/MPN/PAD-1 family protein [Candidatus Aenigmarchaeota archaeon]